MPTFRIGDAIEVGIPEPSDVTALPGGRFLVVSDLDRTAMIVGRDAAPRPVALGSDDGDESCFEAVTFDAASGRLYVISEERHELEVFDFDLATAVARPRARRALPVLGGGGKKKKGRNKGIEGMAFLPAALSPTGKAHLILAKEARPSALVLVDPEGGDAVREIALDPRIEAACDDFSGLAVDPGTRHLFLCSDESAAFAELELIERDGELRGQLLASSELRDPRGRAMERIEGIAVDGAGDLHVLLENDRELWRFTRG